MSSDAAFPETPGRHPNYVGIGVLRGVAALLVVAFHCDVVLRERFDAAGPALLSHGTAGVDIFFVISGFVMMVSSRNLMRRSDGWRIFLVRRLVRIVPLYWLMTTLMVALLLAAPALNHHAAPSLRHVVASYLFIPARDAAGALRPVLPDGWTLSFEMLFYLLFALALSLRMGVFSLTVPVFVAMAGLALLRHDDWPGWTFIASELPLEFLFGAVVGRLAVGGHVIGRPAALAGLALSVLAFILLSTGPHFGNTVGVGRVSLRVLTYGLPATSMVASLVALERTVRGLSPRWLRALGEASYAIYLCHGFVLAALASMFARFGGVHAGLFIAAGMAASAVAGLALHALVERPMQTRLRQWVAHRDRRGGPDLAPAAP